MQVLPWVLIVLGALISYVLAAVIKKKEFENELKKEKYFYAAKIVGLWLVIIGAFLIFKENGSFGIK